MNFLEQLVSEWYSYQEYFVRTNVKVGNLSRGGYEGELDVVAFHPDKRLLVHVETSGGAASWEETADRLKKKFETASKHYQSAFKFKFDRVEKIAIAGYARPTKPVDLGAGVQLRSVPEFIAEISAELGEVSPWTKKVVPEGYPCLRAIQFAVHFGKGSGSEK